MKKQKIRTILIAALAVAFVVVGVLKLDIEPADNTAPLQDSAIQSDAAGEQQDEQPGTPADSGEDEPAPDEGAAAPDVGETDTQDPSAEIAPPIDDPVVSGPVEDEPAPPADEPTAPSEEEDDGCFVCTIEILCETVVDTSKLENPAVAPYVPADGVILAPLEVEFTPGESVFDILLRATRQQNIQMEFRDDNLYSGKYIEGINYLYELDGGPLSGWMYKVNGQFPNYGCAAYTVEDNDAIVWMYTCDLGLDVGDNSTW